MRTFIFLMMFMGLAILDCHAQNGFRITGKVTNMPDGEVCVVAPLPQGGVDTLGMAPMKDGVFEMTGTVREGCMAILVMPDKKSGLQLMLENADYTLSEDGEGKVTLKGGAAQDLFDQFAEINRKLGEEREAVNKAARSVQTNAQMLSLQNRYNSAVEKAMNQQIELIRANGGNFVSAYMLAGMMQNQTLETLRELYDGFSAEVKDGYYGKMIADQIANMEKVAVGAVCPNFTVLTPEGQPVSLSSIKGKVKLIDFWASWCGPCRNENPRVVKMYGKYHPKGLEIFSVSLDTDKAAWTQAIADDGLTWPQGSELLQVPQVAILFGIKAIPHTILLDENNKIIAKDLRGKELENKIAELLGEN
ncbi:MAG: TlpA disulfide reductase family protein [Marinifilaceae bacterium]|nr:TlpA disulfide reductase family protein [Marinifilaceae bacterium]